MAIKIKRVYDKYSSSDGTRLLVDHLWPRGISKENAKIDEWIKEISPSIDLIKWFGHKNEKWEEFRRKYEKELDEKRELVNKIKKISKNKTVTLVYSAKDINHNNAVVLMEYLAK